MVPLCVKLEVWSWRVKEIVGEWKLLVRGRHSYGDRGGGKSRQTAINI
jgi:hypothetical protein